MKILTLCLGNICRSPTAEAVLRARAEARGMSLTVDSAGTGRWHVGEAPDPRAQEAAAKRGYEMAHLRARQLTPEDFTNFDLILAMDSNNLRDARAIAPRNARARLVRFLDEGGLAGDVPDPYYSGGFDHVLDMIERASDVILDKIEG